MHMKRIGVGIVGEVDIAFVKAPDAANVVNNGVDCAGNIADEFRQPGRLRQRFPQFIEQADAKILPFIDDVVVGCAFENNAHLNRG